MTDPKNWPFPEPPETSCFTVQSITEGRTPVLMVAHDQGDGSWQFLTGDAFDDADAVFVPLQNLVALDPSLLEIAGLPLGWMAWRERVGAAWSKQADANQTDD